MIRATASPRRLLVTGGAGLLAQFCPLLVQQHPSDRVVVVDALTYAGNQGSLGLSGQENFGLFREIFAIALIDQLLQRSDTVAHFAAESHVTARSSDQLSKLMW